MNETKTVTALTADGAPGAKIDLPGDLFDVQTNVPLIHQVVNAQLAAARQGTHATKTRAQVSGGGAKPWRQKGTGRARQGSRRAPQWKGGAVVHGPQPRSYAQRTPKKMIAAALFGVLSDRAREDRIVVLESFVAGEVPSTRKAVAALACVQEHRNKLVVLDRGDFIGWMSARNLPDVHVIAADQLNAYDVVCSDVVVFTKAALEDFVGTPVDAAEGAEADPVVEVAEVKAGKKAAKAEVAADEPVEAAEAEPEAKAPKKAAKAEVAVDEPVEAAEAEPKAKAPKKAPKAAMSPEEAEAKAAKKAEKLASAETETDEVAQAKVDEHPYGPHSYVGEDVPEGFDIKGNADSMKYHTPESPYYSRTVAEVWFDSVEAAEAAGFAGAHGDAGADEEDDK